MKFHTIEDVIQAFVDAKLAIDFCDGTDDQLAELGNILTDHTEARPFDGKSYVDYMIYYRTSYPLLACDDNDVSSYVSRAKDCRKNLLTIAQVLDIAHTGHAVFSDADFDAVF